MENYIFGLKMGRQDLRNRAAHPHQEFPGVIPHAKGSTKAVLEQEFERRIFLISTKIVSHVSADIKKRTKFGWKVLTDWCHANFDISILSQHYFGSNMMPTCAKRQ